MSVREINLLPPERRRRLRNESMAVSLTGILKSINTGLVTMTLIAVAIVVAIWLFAVAVKPTTAEELSQVVDEYQGLRDEVAQKNAVLERLTALGRERIVWSELLSGFFALAPPGVTLHRLGGDVTFVEGAVSSTVLNFGGQAVSRSALIVYEEKLRGMKQVQEVSSPTSNLLERSNPVFQFSLTLTSP